jgi:hypothetical protein
MRTSVARDNFFRSAAFGPAAGLSLLFKQGSQLVDITHNFPTGRGAAFDCKLD